MIAFIEEHREDIGVEPICKVLAIAPSSFYDHMVRRVNPDLLSDRAKRDLGLRPEIERVWDQNYQVYGVCKVWRQLRREGFDVARCERLGLNERADSGFRGEADSGFRGVKERREVGSKAPWGSRKGA